jgi:xyloglucan-specific endo-beta-1,4-glucanase
VTVSSSNSWSTTWNFTDSNYYNVISYPDAVLGWFYGYKDSGTGLPLQLSANTPVTCTANWTITGTWQGDVAFDLWCDATTNPTGAPDHEIMIWTKVSGVGPSLPVVATPTIDGVTWDVYQGTGASLTAFLEHGGGNQYDLGSLNYNVMDFINWMIGQSMIANTEYLISVPFGVELDCTSADPTISGTLNVTNYSVTIGSQIPPVPTGLTATAGNGQVSLSWNEPSGAASNKIYSESTTLRK